MEKLRLALFLICFNGILGQMLHEEPSNQIRSRKSQVRDVGSPLYLTPLIKNGQISEAQNQALVSETLPGLTAVEQPLSYSGFITVNESTNSHMFFWFFPKDPTDPLSVWLQGGPGSSSMLGLFEINGPIQAVSDGNGGVTGRINPNSWTNKASMIYIDNPVGTGFSHTDEEGFVTTQAEVGADLYEFLMQWFTLFPEYQTSNFFVFGESYAGKYVPTLSKKIHDENQNNPSIPINFGGLAVGNGAMSPPDSDIYAEYLYQLALVDEIERDSMLDMEATMKEHVTNEEYTLAWTTWSQEVNYFLSRMGCNYYLDYTLCREPEEEGNYRDYVDLEQTRIASHVGNLTFERQSGEVYNSLINDIMRSQRETVEFLLERYPVMFYNGNLDIVCHHTGIIEMFHAMENWSGLPAFNDAQSVIYEYNGETAAYLTAVSNLRLISIRNAGHMAPRNQPELALDLFSKFVDGIL